MSLEKLQYFFSYTRSDSEFVLKLAKELRGVGANLWLDQLDILGGQHWDSAVEEALKGCKGMIAVLSPESVASDNVMDEVSYALAEGKLVVPVLIRSCSIPYRLQRVQHIDFTEDYDTGFSQLLRALGIEQPVQPPESATKQESVVQESPLPKQSESTPDAPDRPKPTGVETEKPGSNARKTKLLAAVCIVTLIAAVLTVVFLATKNPGKPGRITILSRPKPLSPPEGSSIRDPQIPKLTWEGVPGASSYRVEVEVKSSGGEWKAKRTTGVYNATTCAFTDVRTFRTETHVRWRVCGVDSAGKTGPKMDWREFSYIPKRTLPLRPTANLTVTLLRSSSRSGCTYGLAVSGRLEQSSVTMSLLVRSRDGKILGRESWQLSGALLNQLKTTGTVTETRKFGMPLREGTFFVSVEADSDNRIIETNEADNKKEYQHIIVN